MTAMTGVFIIVCISCFILRGVVEGMIMVAPGDMMHEGGLNGGPRSHDWFGAYHWLALMRDVLLITASCVAVGWADVRIAIPGVLLLGWEMTEVAYAVSRYANIYPQSENVLGIGYRISDNSLTRLHLCRILGGILLLVILI